MHIKVKSIITTLLLLFAVYTPAHATVYLNLNAEDGTVGTYVPNPPFCQTPCSGGGERATYQSSGGTPQGSKYYQWQTVDNQTQYYTESHINYPSGITNIMGTTFYLAYYFRMDRINGLDIWHECSHCGSANKGIYLWGSYLRWTASMGQWDGLWAANQDHRYTVWVGDSNTYNLNPNLKTDGTYCQNQNNYSCANPIQLQYEQWYSLVFAVRIASDNTGSFALYIDGVKIMEYTNITTVANPSPSITDLYLGGTIAQGAYDAPAHYEKFDALMLTDNWQDIINGGYLSKRPLPPTQ